MIHLYKSHSLTILADALAGDLAAGATDDPLQSQTIIVPNHDSARWLSLHLVRKNGLAANIRYQLPSEWIWDIIRRKFPDLPDHLASDLEAIKWALADDFLRGNHESVYQIERYLNSQADNQKEKAAIKLAENIASVFDAYLFYRPKMIIEWQQNAPQKGDAAWQARLWRNLREKWENIHGRDAFSHNKAELFQQVLAAGNSPNQKGATSGGSLFQQDEPVLDSPSRGEPEAGDLSNQEPPFDHSEHHEVPPFGSPLFQQDEPIWVFNTGLTPTPVVQMLQKAGEECSVQIYQLQPSVQMAENDHPLFTSFGREAVRIHTLFQAIADKTHLLFEANPPVDMNHPPAVKPASDTPPMQPPSGLKSTEGAHITHTSSEPTPTEDRASQAAPKPVDNGHSTQPLSRPTSVSDTLLGTIQKEIITNRPITPREELKGYDSVQIRSCHSPLREIEVLHDFLLTRFEQDDTLNPEEILVVTPDPERYIPYVEAVFRVKDGELPRIPVHIGNPGSISPIERAFTDLLNIADSSYEKQELLTLLRSEPVRKVLDLSESDCELIEQWADENQVLWGLDYGEGLPAGSPIFNSWDNMMDRGWMGQLLGDTKALSGGPLVYNGIDGRGREEIWASLAAFLRKLHTFRSGTTQNRRLEQWCIWLQHQIGDQFGADFLMDRASARIVRTLNNLAEYSNLAGSRTPISFRQFRAEMISALEGSRAANAMFNRGVIFSSMVPVRGMPFRIVALVGLNDQTFPRKTGTPDFDLMAQDPLPGERNRKEEDRNLFLQTILSAADTHYCSYIGQSKVDNEEIPPSVVLQQWVDYLSELTGLPESQCIVTESITGFSEKKYNPGSRSLSEIYERAAVQLRSTDEKLDGLMKGPISGKENDASVVTVQDLLSFVKSPVSHFFQNSFQVRMSDFGYQTDEFTLGGLRYHMLYRQALKWKVAGADDQQILRLLRESGSVPYGWPGERSANDIVRSVSHALQIIEQNGWDPHRQSREVDFEVSEWTIRGWIESDAADVLLDIHPSSFKGRNMLQSWVRHLVHGYATAQWDCTYVMTDLKSGKPGLYTFRKPEAPQALLEGLIKLRNLGNASPMLWMPDTVISWLMADEESREAKARAVFEGSSRQSGERDGDEVQLLLGSESAYSSELVDGPFVLWAAEMVRNLVEMG